MILVVAVLAALQQAIGPVADGPQTRVCGEVNARRILRPSCDVVLRVKSSDTEVDVFVPASIAKEMVPRPERLRGASVCFTGISGPSQLSPRMRLTSATGIEIVALPPGLASNSTASIPCGGAVTMPTVVSERKPQYTASAMRAKIEGAVELEATVDADGSVREPRVIRSLHPELDEQAIEAVKGWRFMPGTVDGKPVPVVVDIDLRFTIKQ